MKKLLLAVVLLAGLALVGGNVAKAATASDDTQVNLDVNSTITIDCPATVTMNSITGTGKSSLADTNNEAACRVNTNNSTGYTLSFASSGATMANAIGDTIAAYTAAAPEVWSVASADSEWGARLKTGSTDEDTTKWGATDGYAGKWFAVTNASSFTVVSRSTETPQAGSLETVQFGAEVGSSHFQPTGTYNSQVTFTAVTNA